MSNIFEVEGLTKIWGEKIGINSLKFSISEGTCVGLIGENGSGKTTIMKIIAKLYNPTFCKKMVINNFSHDEREYNDLLSYLPVGGFFSNENFKVRKVKDIISSGISFFHGLNRKEIEEKAKNSQNIKKFMDNKYSEISFGQKNMLSIFFSGLSDFNLMMMDEPFNGLDLKMRLTLINRINELKKQGKSFLISSHDIYDMQKICEEIVVIKNSEAIFIGKTPENLENFLINNYGYELQWKNSEENGEGEGNQNIGI